VNSFLDSQFTGPATGDHRKVARLHICGQMRTLAFNRAEPIGGRRLAVSADSGGVMFGIGLIEIVVIALLLVGLGFLLRALLRC